MIGESATVASYDIADGGLIDVRSFSLGDLLDEPDQSSLARALERILASDDDSAPQNGFRTASERVIVPALRGAPPPASGPREARTGCDVPDVKDGNRGQSVLQ